MKIQSKILSLKDGRAITLRSATAEDAKSLLAHLTISHSESYRNLNSSAERWKNFSVDEEAKILMDFEKADNKFMVVALSKDRIIGGLGFVGSFFDFCKHSASIGMSIQQEFANLGLGKGILEYALEAGKRRGFS